jgi:hypothetical protein
MAGGAQRALGGVLVLDREVEASTTIRRGSLAALIALTVAISACGFGRLVMMVGTTAASAATSSAISTPALASSLRLAASMS